MAYYKESQKKYNDKSIFFHVKYTPKEHIEGKRLKQYLADTGQSANSYIKGLVKKELDEKGYRLDKLDNG